MELFRPYILAFIPIFVAVDALGNIPLFISLTEGLNAKKRKEIVLESVVTATVIAIIFMLVGKVVLRIMGITVSDFKIAGGILLLILSVNFLLPGKTKGFVSPPHSRDVGIFPLGTPLITGPAVLTTTLIIIDEYGLAPTYISLILNMSIVWMLFIKSDLVMKLMGIGGTRAFSKVADILLASIAVTMIRGGVMEFLFSIR